ncbi:hypothetical protein [Sphingomonas sp. VNH70]|uniref:hypothetical protein n=1 Tax=Sphingomonas silueang TaxID=3156617 RepID=UPI0032B46A04
MVLDKRYTTIGMVAFIDLLGFSERVKAITKIEHLKSIERDVRRTQAWFDHRTKDEVLKTSHKLKRKKVLAFSDCLVLTIPAFSELAEHEGDFDVLMEEIPTIARAQALCVTNGIFLRGGISFGLWHKRGDRIVSPAMVEAYEAEGAAVVPMIAIAETMLKHFKEHPHRDFYSKDSDPFRRYFRYYDNLPAPPGETRSAWVIDYLPLCLGELDWIPDHADMPAYLAADPETRARIQSEAYDRNVRHAIEVHRQAIVSAHAAAGVPKVRAKYAWLAHYHDDAVGRFWPGVPSGYLIGALSI